MVHYRKYPLFIKTKHPQSLNFYIQWLRRRCIYKKVHYFTSDLYLRHKTLPHMTYAPTKFEVAIPNGLGGIAFTRNIWFDLGSHEVLPSTSCDLCTCKVWSSYGQWLRRCVYKKIHYLKSCPVPSTSRDLCTSKVWCCYIPRLKRRCIYKKKHYLILGSRSQEIFEVAMSKGLGDAFTRKHIIWPWPRNIAQYLLHHVTYAATKFEVAPSNGLGGDTFTRNVTDRRQRDFGTNLIYPFCLKKKAVIITTSNPEAWCLHDFVTIHKCV